MPIKTLLTRTQRRAYRVQIELRRALEAMKKYARDNKGFDPVARRRQEETEEADEKRRNASIKTERRLATIGRHLGQLVQIEKSKLAELRKKTDQN